MPLDICSFISVAGCISLMYPKPHRAVIVMASCSGALATPWPTLEQLLCVALLPQANRCWCARLDLAPPTEQAEAAGPALLLSQLRERRREAGNGDALDALGVPHEHAFCSEVWETAIRAIRAMDRRPRVMYRDVTEREVESAFEVVFSIQTIPSTTTWTARTPTTSSCLQVQINSRTHE